MDCPKCGLINPEGASRCDCGFSFGPTSLEQQPATGVEQSGLGTETALAPHKYPLWIWLMGFSIAASLVVSLIQLPPYYRAAALVQRAETLAEQGQDKSAVEFFKNALEITPSSKRVRIGLAISYFRSPDDENHKRALTALQGLTLEKNEWQKLAAIMPAAYQRFFTDVKK